jgi:hypothetical protein
MQRRVKKGSGIYTYLQATGLLEHGTEDQIIAAKKMYWKQFRKIWKQQHRIEHKSYTISFSAKEQKIVHNAAKQAHTSITTFIKNSCLQTPTSTPIIDKKAIGKIRELLLLFHSELDKLKMKQYQVDDCIIQLGWQYSLTETTILKLLTNTKTLPLDY